MRLLQRSDTGEFSLTQFRDEAIPPYAILSHTWGVDAEEVTFEDLTNGTGTDKPGYEKIRFCREQAALDDLEWFWIDTCCINKANKAELSQAINSMFRWYGNATRCYVYLSDVCSTTFDTNEELLMNKENPLCPNHNKTKSNWTRYIEGASAVFAWSVSRGETVVVLSPPPPQRFNPIGLTNFQMIEAPILHWAAALSHTRLQIHSVHPMVNGAEDFRYQIWPVDETRNWDMSFKTVQFQQREWRVPSQDSWKILIRSTLDSMVGSGFWIGSDLFGLSKWKQGSARMKEEEEQKKREYKLKEEAKKIEKRKKLGQEEEKKKPTKAKTSRNITEGQKPGQEQKKCTKKKKKGKKRRKGGGNEKVEKKKVEKRKKT